MRVFIALGCALLLGGVTARAEPANTLKAMYGEMSRCLSPIRVAKGTEVTIQFMLNRRGGIIGKPRITYAHWVGDEASRKASAASIAENFDRCLPLTITDGLGGAIAGRMFLYRLTSADGGKDL